MPSTLIRRTARLREAGPQGIGRGSRLLRRRALIDVLPATISIAHRGGSLIFPENTLEAFAGAQAAGARALEMDAYLLTDGTLGIMHDATVDRTSTSTGNVADLDAAGFTALDLDTDAWFFGNFGTLHPPLFSDVLAAYGGRVALFVEGKNTGACSALADAVVAAGLQRDVLICSVTLSELADAVTAGIPAMLVSDAATPATVVAAGVEWIGVSTSATESYVNDCNAAGLQVIVHTVSRHYIRDTWLARNVRGFFSDDPIYLSGSGYRRTTDPFAANTWYHGHQGNAGGGGFNLRGSFTDGRYQFPLNASAYSFQGWGSPIAAAAGSYTITYTITVDVLGGTTTGWVACTFCCTDDWPHINDANAAQSGYTVLLRDNGALELYQDDGGAATLLDSDTTAAITQGNTATIEVAVTPTSLTVTRTDVDPPVAVTSSDTTDRGGYFHFLQKNAPNAQHSISNVTIVEG